MGQSLVGEAECIEVIRKLRRGGASFLVDKSEFGEVGIGLREFLQFRVEIEGNLEALSCLLKVAQYGVITGEVVVKGGVHPKVFRGGKKEIAGFGSASEFVEAESRVNSHPRRADCSVPEGIGKFKRFLPTFSAHEDMHAEVEDIGVVSKERGDVI